MPAIFEGHTVTILRPVIPGEQSFKEGDEKFLVRLSDGTEKIVAKDDLSDDEQPETKAQVVAAPVPPPKKKQPAATPSRKRRR